MFKKDLLKDKRILVTGGGTGLGKEMANHYAEHGAELFICGRRENVLKETADEIIDKYNTNVNYQTLDIRASKDVDDYIQSIFTAQLCLNLRILLLFQSQQMNISLVTI